MTPIGNNAAERLRSFLERVEFLQAEQKSLASDIRDIKGEVKSAGFDLKIFNQMLRERALSAEELEEQVALAEIYRRALGMLADTPLGEAARRKLTKPPPKPPADPPEQPGAPDAETPPPEPVAPITSEDIAAARAAGMEAAQAGQKVTDNPYPAGDPRRGAWDEGWCAGAGSDGMDIPAAWRRSPKPKGPEK